LIARRIQLQVNKHPELLLKPDQVCFLLGDVFFLKALANQQIFCAGAQKHLWLCALFLWNPSGRGGGKNDAKKNGNGRTQIKEKQRSTIKLRSYSWLDHIREVLLHLEDVAPTSTVYLRIWIITGISSFSEVQASELIERVILARGNSPRQICLQCRRSTGVAALLRA
jgi:hypothetical protein